MNENVNTCHHHLQDMGILLLFIEYTFNGQKFLRYNVNASNCLNMQHSSNECKCKAYRNYKTSCSKLCTAAYKCSLLDSSIVLYISIHLIYNFRIIQLVKLQISVLILHHLQWKTISFYVDEKYWTIYTNECNFMNTFNPTVIFLKYFILCWQ